MRDPKSISTHYEIEFHCFTLRNTKCIKNLSIYSFKCSLDRCYNLAQKLTQKKVLQSCQSTISVLQTPKINNSRIIKPIQKLIWSRNILNSSNQCDELTVLQLYETFYFCIHFHRSEMFPNGHVSI